MSRPADDPRFAQRAILRLSMIEFWERYSFYTMFALLALFVSAPVGAGGMGWSNGQSLRFFGAYLLTVQASPIIGGFLADRWIGKRAALRIGALALLLGHALLATAATIPWLATDMNGATLLAKVAQVGGVLGQFTLPSRLPAELTLPYHAVAACFFAAVTLVAIGNGLFKPILTVVVGRLPHASDAARTAAFTTFFLYINVGGLMSVLLGGWLSQRFGWGWAFGGSSLGMAISIATMIVLDRVYVRPFLDAPEAPKGTANAKAPRRAFPASIVALLALLVLCSSFSYQSYGFVSLFTAQFVDRSLGGFVIPTAWFTAMNPVTIMALTPVLLGLWRRGGMGAKWSTTQHIAAGLVLMGLGFAPLVVAAAQAQETGLASPAWVAVTIMLIAASELLYAPAGMAAATRIAPPRYQTLAIGSQGAAVGVGAWISGQLGAAAFESDKVVIMSAVAAAALVVGAGLFASRKLFERFGL